MSKFGIVEQMIPSAVSGRSDWMAAIPQSETASHARHMKTTSSAFDWLSPQEQ